MRHLMILLALLATAAHAQSFTGCQCKADRTSGVLKSAKEKRGRIGSASESAAAYPVLAEVLSTNLPKKPLNKLAEKQFW